MLISAEEDQDVGPIIYNAMLRKQKLFLCMCFPTQPVKITGFVKHVNAILLRSCQHLAQINIHATTCLNFNFMVRPSHQFYQPLWRHLLLFLLLLFSFFRHYSQ